MEKLLAEGKTDLLTRFISKKGRPFKAFLARQPEGRVGFEFMPRAIRPGGATAAPAETNRPARAKAPIRAKAPAAGKTAAVRKPPARKKAPVASKAPRKRRA